MLKIILMILLKAGLTKIKFKSVSRLLENSISIYVTDTDALFLIHHSFEYGNGEMRVITL